MIEIPSLRPETRYGMPPADRFLFNRQYVVGYSYLFRQPRWALELIDDQTMQMEDEELERLDNFREDLRIPDMFRSTLSDYAGSGYDRGHLISSADRLGRAVVNSETFLMTNMSPQKPGFNRDVWKQLEQAVRNLAAQEKYAEVYAICGPLFKIGDPIEVIGENHVVVPDAFFKSVLAEEKRAVGCACGPSPLPMKRRTRIHPHFWFPPRKSSEGRGCLSGTACAGARAINCERTKDGCGQGRSLGRLSYTESRYCRRARGSLGGRLPRIDRLAVLHGMHVVVRLSALAFSVYFLVSPLRGQTADQRPGKSSSDAPTFVDVAASSEVDFKNEPSPTLQKYLPESMVGGVAMLDYNGDGLLDLYFVNGAGLEDPMPPGKSPNKSEPRYWNRLYRNNGDGTFSDTTKSAGVAGKSYGQGVAVGDYDNDGRPDLYVTNFGPNNLYRNEGDGAFSEVTREAGVSGGGWSAGAMFVDYDHDGHLDLIVSRYLAWDFDNNRWCGEKKPGYRAYCHPDHFDPLVHIVYHNNGDGTFEEATKASGIGASPGKGLGVAFNDFDRDGWPDLLVANDSAPQQLFRNRGDGTFEEVGLFAGIAFDADGNTFAGMGVDFVDYDNDGWPDAIINALAEQKYSLYRNVSGEFEYHSEPSGVSSITLMHSGWGMKFVDFDNDGWKDLFVAQGHVVDNVRLTKPALRYKEPLLLMRNDNGRFEDVSEQSGPAFRIPRAGRGAAFGDLDNDGFLDVAVNCNRESAVVLKNSGNNNHWLIVKTIGAVSNRDGIGAQLRLVAESGKEQYGLVTTAGSYLSASDRRVHFGLGSDKRVKLLEIAWPSGTRQRFKDLAGDQILTVREPAESDEERPAR